MENSIDKRANKIYRKLINKCEEDGFDANQGIEFQKFLKASYGVNNCDDLVQLCIGMNYFIGNDITDDEANRILNRYERLLTLDSDSRECFSDIWDEKTTQDFYRGTKRLTENNEERIIESIKQLKKMDLIEYLHSMEGLTKEEKELLKEIENE